MSGAKENDPNCWWKHGGTLLNNGRFAIVVVMVYNSTNWIRRDTLFFVIDDPTTMAWLLHLTMNAFCLVIVVVSTHYIPRIHYFVHDGWELRWFAKANWPQNATPLQLKATLHNLQCQVYVQYCTWHPILCTDIRSFQEPWQKIVTNMFIENPCVYSFALTCYDKNLDTLHGLPLEHLPKNEYHFTLGGGKLDWTITFLSRSWHPSHRSLLICM